MFLFSYTPGSRSSKLLAEKAGLKRIKHRNSKFKMNPRKKVVNWGAAKLPDKVWGCDVINRHVLTDKLAAFNRIGHKDWLVPWADTQDTAKEWLNNGNVVVARTMLRAHSGRGIVLCGYGHGDLVQAPLFTRYVKKKYEYRVHITRLGNFIVDWKARVLDHPNPNWQIRNHGNGFRYLSCGDYPLPIINAAKLALEAMKYDFGAVDILWNEHEGSAYVCEVNAAPGLENTRTLEFYCNARS